MPPKVINMLCLGNRQWQTVCKCVIIIERCYAKSSYPTNVIFGYNLNV